MRIVPVAEVFTPEHWLHQHYVDGDKTTPGHLLADVLRQTGGRYEVTTDLPDRTLAEVRSAAAGVTDPTTEAALRTGTVRISLEHLRGHDPGTTRIVYGFRTHPDDGDPTPGSDDPA